MAEGVGEVTDSDTQGTSNNMIKAECHLNKQTSLNTDSDKLQRSRASSPKATLALGRRAQRRKRLAAASMVSLSLSHLRDDILSRAQRQLCCGAHCSGRDAALIQRRRSLHSNSAATPVENVAG